MPFSCGVMQHHPESPFATSGWSWPFTRIDLRADSLLVYTPVLFGRWALDVAYADIERAAVHPRRWGGRITLERTGGHVTITTLTGSYTRIAELLRDKGVRIGAVSSSARL